MMMKISVLSIKTVVMPKKKHPVFQIRFKIAQQSGNT